MLARLLALLGIAPRQCACVGDDRPDVPLLAQAGLAVAVADAHPDALAIAHRRTRLPGGAGAVREVCDWLLAAATRQRARMILRMLFARAGAGGAGRAALSAAVRQRRRRGASGRCRVSTEPGYVAIGAELIETGDDGQPLFRLDAERIEQPHAAGHDLSDRPEARLPARDRQSLDADARSAVSCRRMRSTAELAGDGACRGPPDRLQRR